MNKRIPVSNGLIVKNTVLSGLMVISPVIVCGNTVIDRKSVV